MIPGGTRVAVIAGIMSTPTWTPGADISTFPAISEYRCAFQVYFYDMITRREIMIPASGAMYGGRGAYATSNGAYVDQTLTSVEVVAVIEGKQRIMRITAESFPGRKVCVKVWGPDSSSYTVLASGDNTFVKVGTPRIGAEWIAAYKAA
jgi:hypothetical protein